MKTANIYTSIACNRTPAAMDWGDNGLILFAACNSVAILDPQYNGSSKIIKIFVEHTQRVNTVKWISSENETSEYKFISGSDDNLCIIWDKNNNSKTYKLEGHTGPVTVVETIYVNNLLTVITASSDSTIKFWHKEPEHNNYICFQTISLQNGLCFSIKCCVLKNTILMAIATDDNNIHLYAEHFQNTTENSSRQFIKVETLLGHEDWVRGLDIILSGNDEVMLASSSQDTFIRLWKISLCSSVKDINFEECLQIEEKKFTIYSKNGDDHQYSVALESVLLGHDAWVYGVHWRKTENGLLELLSSSIDKTLIIWSCVEGDVWMEKIRVGDVGGNSLGFFGGKFSPTGTAIVGHGYQGGFHLWHQSIDDSKSWVPGVIVGGHFGAVRDLAWEPKGLFLYSVSADQTTRIHAPWIKDGSIELTWHELARPQVHGYDMQAFAVLSRYSFASGAEEKIVRTFQAPGNFVENLKRITSISSEDGDDFIKSTSKGASLPSLGLSNKAVHDTDISQKKERHIKDEYADNDFVSIISNEPPAEATLMQNTLWPEIQKLYGHGYDIFALCATSDGKTLASSCKATNAEHAQIILWDTTTWKQKQNLSSHQLTVTQMKFSPDHKYLLSVARDRRWSLFENINYNSEHSNFVLIATTDKRNGIHGRIIWTCDWSHDSKIFATASRDGKIVAWHRGDEKMDSTLGYYKSIDTLELKNCSVTALAFSRGYYKDGQYLLALGLESGEIYLYSLHETWNLLHTIDKNLAHHLTIKKLEFRPNYKNVHLVSCGEDNLVRIYELIF